MSDITLLSWMRVVEETIAEMAFAISRGETLPANAECFALIQHGVREIRGLREDLQDGMTVTAVLD